MKKFLSIVMSIMTFVSVLPAMAFAEEPLFDGGSGTRDDPYQITNETQLRNIDTDLTAIYELKNDITMTSDNFMPIGPNSTTPFRGVLYGNDHKIVNFKQTQLLGDGQYGGLFGYINGGRVTNLEMENVNVKNSSNNAYAGGIAGYIIGDVVNCKVSGTVNSTSWTGGIVGYNKGNITNCTMSGTVSSTSIAGGMTGEFNSGVIDSCSTSGKVGSDDCAGGIAGYTSTTNATNHKIINCNNEATVYGKNCAGGIFGGGSKDTMTCRASKNTGTISGNRAAGIGCCSVKNIIECENAGQISGEHCAAGISVDASGTVQYCINIGEVSAPTAAGIVTKYNYYVEKLSCCLNSGTITGSLKVAGILISGYYRDTVFPELSKYRGTVSACYNTGKLVGEENAGTTGVAYDCYSSENSYNTGIISAKYGYGVSNKAVTISYNAGKMYCDETYPVSSTASASCYYMDNITEETVPEVAGCTPLTPDQMEMEESFEGFNFVKDWTMDGNKEYFYPELQSVEMITIKSDEIEKTQQAHDVMDLITAFPAEITLDNKDAVEAARTAYDAYIEKYGKEAASKVANYVKLLEAEKTILKLQLKDFLNLKNATISNIPDSIYTGNSLMPKVTVALNGATLVKDRDYKVSYANNVSVGTATVKIEGIGVYNGEASKTFSILPKGTVLSKIKAGKKAMAVTWKKQAVETTGYQLQYSLKANMAKAKSINIAKNSIASVKIKKLVSKKRYFVRIRTFKKVGTANFYSAWSKTKFVKIK